MALQKKNCRLEMLPYNRHELHIQESTAFEKQTEYSKKGSIRVTRSLNLNLVSNLCRGGIPSLGRVGRSQKKPLGVRFFSTDAFILYILDALHAFQFFILYNFGASVLALLLGEYIAEFLWNVDKIRKEEARLNKKLTWILRPAQSLFKKFRGNIPHPLVVFYVACAMFHRGLIGVLVKKLQLRLFKQTKYIPVRRILRAIFLRTLFLLFFIFFPIKLVGLYLFFR